MMTARRRRWIIGGLVAAAIVAVAGPPLARAAWMRAIGGIYPTSTSEMDIGGTRVQVVTAGGPRGTSSPNGGSVAAYHVVILLPSIPVRRGRGISHFHTGGSGTYEGAWPVTVAGGAVADAKLAVHYDGAWDRVEIGARRFAARKGNIFVVRVRPGRPPEARQLAGVEPRFNLDQACLATWARGEMQGDADAQQALARVHCHPSSPIAPAPEPRRPEA